MSNTKTLVGAFLFAALAAWGCESQQPDVLGPNASEAPILKKGGVPGPPGGGDDGGSQCKLTFSLDNIASDFMQSDAGGPYVNKAQKVQVTGGETGWRYDTNGMQTELTTRDKRWVVIGGNDVAIDMRFDQDEGGLNFCALDHTEENGPASGTVAVAFTFAGADGNSTTWRYGGTSHSGDLCTEPLVTVTRTSESTWTLASGSTACVMESGGIVNGMVAAQVSFEVTRL